MKKEQIAGIMIGKLMNIGGMLERQGNKMLLPYNLNQQQFSIFFEIAKVGKVKQKEMVNRLLLEKAHVSKVVKKLQQMDLITVTQNDEDKRSYWLSVTETGKEVLKQCSDMFGKWNKEWIREIDAKWEMTEVLGNNWKEEIRPVLEIHTNRTPGSFIEEKDFSLAWHYRRCDPDLASIRVSELKEALMNLTRNLNIGLLDGNKVIEVKDTTINKGRGVTHWLGKESYDFILSIGDDWTDEDMFSVLPKNAYSIKIGYHLSHARFTIDSVESARNLLKSLVE